MAIVAAIVFAVAAYNAAATAYGIWRRRRNERWWAEREGRHSRTAGPEAD